MKHQIKQFNLCWLLALSVMIFGCSHLTRTIDGKSYDVGLRAVPVSVKVIMSGMVVDAIEKGAPEYRYAVTFQIEKVLTGEFTKEKIGGPSKLEQAKDAVKDRQLLKILTLDFDSPDEMVEKKWIRIAVFDPEELFSIQTGEAPASKRWNLYLKRNEKMKDSFILVGQQLSHG